MTLIRSLVFGRTFHCAAPFCSHGISGFCQELGQ
jgi:hypothetical protein